ncbi:MAG: transposase [Bdellovibrionales bacterium]
MRRLLLKNRYNLKYYERNAFDVWLTQYPKLKEIYWYKEALHRLYRTRGANKAARAFTRLTDQMGLSKLKEIKKLRKTLMKWRKEILNYFSTGLTNGAKLKATTGSQSSINTELLRSGTFLTTGFDC